MLALKFLRENIDLVAENCKIRNFAFTKDAFVQLEKERLTLLKINESKREEMNRNAKQIGFKKKAGEEISPELQAQMKSLKDSIKENEDKLKAIAEEVNQIAFSLPNLIAEDVPRGLSEADNEMIRDWGAIPNFSFPILDHVAILEKNDWVDFERASQIAGSRFVILKGEILKLQRALLLFLIEENTKKGYLEIQPPSIVNEKSLFGTGQLPKFKKDLFFLSESFSHFALIPTSEVPLTNLYGDSILKESDLPINLTAHTPCYRSEAGSAGRDTKGLIRLHEFSKVELVKIVASDRSEAEHQNMVNDAEDLLKKLKLPFRVLLLSSGDTGFSAKKCYDIEVWLPGQNAYREISSCSNCGDFQARRIKTRYYKDSDGPTKKETEYVHTLNGSALPLGRTLVAILENYQKPDGTIEIPEVLKKFYF